MSDNEICDEGLAGLARAVARNSSIRLLELCFNRITAAGAEALAKSIWGTTGLKALRLDNNQAGTYHDRGAQALAIALPTLGLETLDVGFSHVGTAGVAALMQATANSPSFTSLSLSGNALDAEAAKAIQAALAQPRCSLRCLYLDHTSLGRASEGFIANGVLSNRSLALVTLTGFRLGSSFARLGMPPQVANFSNDQALEQVRLYWANHINQAAAAGRSGGRRGLAAAGGGEEQEVAAAAAAATAAAKRDPGDGGSRIGDGAGKDLTGVALNNAHQPQRRQQFMGGGSPTAAVVTEKAIPPHPPSEYGPHHRSRYHQRHLGHQQNADPPGVREGALGAAAAGHHGGGSEETHHPGVLARAVSEDAGCQGGVGNSGGGGTERAAAAVPEALRASLVEALHQIAQLPFSAAELWSLHQHYFSPPLDHHPSPSSHSSPTSAASTPSPSTCPSKAGPGRTWAAAAAAAAAAATCGGGLVNGLAIARDIEGRGGNPAGVLGPPGGGSRGCRGEEEAEVGAGARRSRRSASMGQEQDLEVDSPPPPSKRYRNNSAGASSGSSSFSSTKTRIACFPSVEARVRALKSKPDDRGILTVLRQLKYLQTASEQGGKEIGGGGGSNSDPAAGGGVVDDGVLGPKNEVKNVLGNVLTDAQIERILLEEL
ncbi:unnamed protein product [Ectocarpus sp. 13 AM-2016]